MKKIAGIMIVVSLLAMVASSALALNSYWFLAAGGSARSDETEAKGTAFLGYNLNYKGAVAHDWANDKSVETLKVPLGLPGTDARIYVAPWAENLEVDVYISRFPLRGKVDPCDPTLKKLEWNPCLGYEYCYQPTTCEAGRFWIYGVVHGGKRKVRTIPLPVVDWIFPNAGTFVSHKDSFQLLGTLPFYSFQWDAPTPRTAAELGDYLLGKAQSGGSSPHLGTIIANREYDDAMMKPGLPGGYRISFVSANGTPYTGWVRMRIQSKRTGNEYSPQQPFKAPVLTMGSTTPGSYVFTFWLSDGNTISEERPVSKDAVLTFIVP